MLSESWSTYKIFGPKLIIAVFSTMELQTVSKIGMHYKKRLTMGHRNEDYESDHFPEDPWELMIWHHFMG
jgi:hypothetical protein